MVLDRDGPYSEFSVLIAWNCYCFFFFWDRLSFSSLGQGKIRCNGVSWCTVKCISAVIARIVISGRRILGAVLERDQVIWKLQSDKIVR